MFWGRGQIIYAAQYEVEINSLKKSLLALFFWITVLHGIQTPHLVTFRCSRSVMKEM